MMISKRSRRCGSALMAGLLLGSMLFPSALVLASEPVDRVGALEGYFRELRALEDRLPAAEYDPAALVRELGTDAERLAAWVKGETVWVPYAGRLRSPAAVMMDGSGNSLDRAVLLAELLRLAGHEAVLAWGEAERVMPADGRVLREAWLPPVAEVPAGLTDAEAAGVFSGWVSGYERTLEAMAGRLAVQVPAVQEVVAGMAGAEAAEAGRESREWWVVLSPGAEGERALYLGEGEVPAEAGRVAVGALEESLLQEVRVSVWIERLGPEGFEGETVFEHAVRPAEHTHPTFTLGLMADEVNLTYEAAKEMGEDFPQEVLAQMGRASNWVPYLAMGSEEVVQKGFDAAGKVNEDHLLSAQGRAVGRAAGLLGGLGGFGGETAGSAGSVLSAVEVVFAWTGPGGAGHEEVRRIYDLFEGDRLRGDGVPAVPVLSDAEKTERGLALSHHSEVLVLSGWMPRSYATASQVRTLLGNRGAILGALHFEAAGDMERLQASLESLSSFPAQLSEWAVYRSEMNPEQGKLYAGEAQVVAWHHRFGLGADGVPVLQRGYDVVGNRVRSTAAGRDAVVMQGVVDAVAESVLAEARGLRGLSTSGRMAADGEGWVTVASAEALEALGLAPSLAARLGGVLAEGRVLMVPPDVQEVPAEEAVWWEIDPATGGVMARIDAGGWGGFGEYLVQLYVAKAQIGLLALSVYMCHTNMTLSCFLCNYIGATIIVLSFMTTGFGAAAALAVAGGVTNLGCGVWSAVEGAS